MLDAVGPGPKSAFPTRILLYASARDYASIRPASNVPGFYQSGPERDYIAMLAGAEIDRIVLHEYTHAVLNHALPRLPQWLEEGLAEYYSTLSAAGGKATLGAPVAAHIETLRTSDWLPAATLAAVAKDSPHYNEAGKNTVFYAQSWALTHMLERGAAYRGKLPDYIERLSKGEPQAAAFQASFGRSWEEALAGLPAYVRAGFSSITVEAPPAGALLFSPVEALDPVEAAQSRAEILLLEGRDPMNALVNELLALRASAKFLWPIMETGVGRRLSRVKAPTLVATSSKDVVVPAAHGTAWQSRIRGARLTTIKDAGHVVELEQPEVFATLVRDFIKADRVPAVA